MSRHTARDSWPAHREIARQMRRDPTQAEDLLWQQIRNKKLLGAKFRRQHPIGRFIVDFYCVESGLVIEVDGAVHEKTLLEDNARQEFLEDHGLRVHRVGNSDVQHHMTQVLAALAALLQPSGPPTIDVPHSRGGGGVA